MSGEDKFQQVFLSHSVRSAGAKAIALNEKLKQEGFTTFICVDMDAGDKFREAITGNASNCKVMVVFLDESWAQSRECKSEFNCAYSCYTRHESPQVVPIVIGGFQWIVPETYSLAHCISSNFQCLCAQGGRSLKYEVVCDILILI